MNFIDEVFNSDLVWLESFLTVYKQEIGLPFCCFLFPDLIGEDIISKLKKAGCYKVQMGVQVIDEKKRNSVLKRYSKTENIARAIDKFRKKISM